MFTNQQVKSSIISILGIAAFAVSTVFFVSCEEAEDALTNTVCQDVALDCDRSPYKYQACANGSGDSWWELNGTRYDDVNAVTEAYLNYCN
ncbi:hypothetical protein [Polaribacter sp.]|uniref:hypothetical protein n=1 Tax=Polaribacter sp. TaxID=1920175 RepID=UPI003F6BCD90